MQGALLFEISACLIEPLYNISYSIFKTICKIFSKFIPADWHRYGYNLGKENLKATFFVPAEK